MKVQKLSLLFAPTSVLILSIMACMINVGGPAYPDRLIPVSTEAVNNLQSAIQTAVAVGDSSNKVTLVITEPQLTSYLAARLQTQAQPLFSNPQVYLHNGQIQIYGTAQQGYFQANIEIVVTTSIDDQGQLKIELTSADFGPFPIPPGLKDAVSATLEEAYTGAIGPAAIGFRLDSITVGNGTMTIVGRRK